MHVRYKLANKLGAERVSQDVLESLEADEADITKEVAAMVRMIILFVVITK